MNDVGFQEEYNELRVGVNIEMLEELIDNDIVGCYHLLLPAMDGICRADTKLI